MIPIVRYVTPSDFVCIFYPFIGRVDELNSNKHPFDFLCYYTSPTSSAPQVCVASSEEVPTPTQEFLIAMAPGSQEKITAINRRKRLPPLLRPTFLPPRQRLVLNHPKSRHSLPAPLPTSPAIRRLCQKILMLRYPPVSPPRSLQLQDLRSILPVEARVPKPSIQGPTGLPFLKTVAEDGHM